jgi:hypothetical protein
MVDTWAAMVDTWRCDVGHYFEQRTLVIFDNRNRITNAILAKRFKTYGEDEEFEKSILASYEELFEESHAFQRRIIVAGKDSTVFPDIGQKSNGIPQQSAKTSLST